MAPAHGSLFRTKLRTRRAPEFPRLSKSWGSGRSRIRFRSREASRRSFPCGHGNRRDLLSDLSVLVPSEYGVLEG